MSKICGIYSILNKLNNKTYIGSSCDIERRWRHHRQNLNKGIHHCIHLQRAWNKYGFGLLFIQYLLVDIRKETKRRPENTYLINSTIYTFYHEDGTIFRGRAYDFIKKYNLLHSSVWSVIKGRYKKTKGWGLYSNQFSRQNDQ